MGSLPIINSIYDAYKSIVELNAKLEKRWRYGIGLSLENTTLSCMEHLIMAKNAPKTLKAAYLIKAGAELEITTLKLRLYLEFRLANETRIFQLQARLAEVGRMLGGWLKAAQSM